MTSKEITIKLHKGLEARFAAMLVQVASQYESSVRIEYAGNRQVNAKSIMGMMTLDVKDGDKLTVITEGSDEEKALEGMEEYLTR